MKRIISQFLNPIKNNKYIIKFLRKPFNTWFLSRFSYKKSASKEAKIWLNQKHYKIDFYEETTSKYVSSFINYLLLNTSKEDVILDICCNQGRFLKALHQNGYHSLMGVDIMKEAILNLQNSKEYNSGGIFAKVGLVQDYLTGMKNQSIDYAITYSATIELVHPGFNIFKELSRITRKGFIFVINENGHTYPRFYRYLIKSNQFKFKCIKQYGKNLTLMHVIK